MLEKGFKDRLGEKIDQLFIDFTKPYTPGCIVCAIKDGEIIFQNTYGLANLELEVPINEATVFNVGSVSKQFTAMAIALLEESGSINLNDSLLKYIPELPNYCSRITVADLVYMTNGIRDFFHITQFIMGVVEDDFVSKEEALQLLCNIETPIFAAGQKWMYGNSGYFLLGIIIERITGKSLAEYAKENIFEPLGMKNTFFRNNRSKVIKNRAYGYCKYEYLHPNDTNNSGKGLEAWDNHCLNVDNSELIGPGQLWTTVGDLYLWDQNYYNNKLGKGNQSLMTKVTTSGKTLNGEDCGYGYGLFLGERRGYKYHFHGGSTAGFLSAFYRIPEENLTIIYLSNSNYGYYQLGSQLGTGIDKYIGDLILNWNKDNGEATLSIENQESKENYEGYQLPVSIQRHELKRYVGSYQCPETASVWEIELRDDKLVVVENREGEFALEAIDRNVFKGANCSIRCNFEGYEAGKTSIKVYKEGNEYFFKLFIADLTMEGLREYLGVYYCDQLDTTFIVTLDENRLYVRNKDRHRNGINFQYTPSVKDHFINFNTYAGSMMITFKRDVNDKISAFVFRDYDGDKREDLQFKRLI